jgi:hypothetical protein
MTSTFFDAGDLQRLDREASLTEEAPRVLPEDDRSPVVEEDNDFDIMLDALALILKGRLE